MKVRCVSIKREESRARFYAPPGCENSTEKVEVRVEVHFKLVEPSDELPGVYGSFLVVMPAELYEKASSLVFGAVYATYQVGGVYEIVPTREM